MSPIFLKARCLLSRIFFTVILIALYLFAVPDVEGLALKRMRVRVCLLRVFFSTFAVPVSVAPGMEI